MELPTLPPEQQIRVTGTAVQITGTGATVDHCATGEYLPVGPDPVEVPGTADTRTGEEHRVDTGVPTAAILLVETSGTGIKVDVTCNQRIGNTRLVSHRVITGQSAAERPFQRIHLTTVQAKTYVRPSLSPVLKLPLIPEEQNTPVFIS